MGFKLVIQAWKPNQSLGSIWWSQFPPKYHVKKSAKFRWGQGKVMEYEIRKSGHPESELLVIPEMLTFWTQTVLAALIPGERN